MFGRRVHETAEEITQHQQRLADFEVDHAENRHRVAAQETLYQTASQDLVARREQLEHDRTRRLQLTRMVSSFSGAIATLRTQISSVEAARTKVVSQIDQLDGDLAGQQLERDRCLQRVDEAVQNQSL